MFKKRKKTLTLKVFVVLLSFAMATVGFSTNGGSARIIPSGKVLIIKDGLVVGEFSNEAPLPEGALLKCEGTCSVKLDDVYMVVEKDTVFSIQQLADLHELYVQEGTVYYSLTESSRPIHLNTPVGDATTGDLSLSETDLRGYVRTSGLKAEIGVVAGGKMTVQTASGNMIVTPGNQITIAALARGGEGTPTVAREPGGLTRNQQIALGAAGVGLMTVATLALFLGGGGDGGGDGSPASP